MKLSISNIAWAANYDEEMYSFLSEIGFKAIEIAPTRIFPENPYDKINEARNWAIKLKHDFDLEISSMQSIWYGKNENIFNSSHEKEILLEYTKKAILFAEAIKCHNLVFGCPKNRDTKLDFSKALLDSKDFFQQIGDFANLHNTVFAIEANPTIYNTRFINYTKEAFNLAETVSSAGLKVNVDLGTILQNGEDISVLSHYSDLINHVHISEPNLEIISERKMHSDLFMLLKKINYKSYVSIEMKNCNDIENVKRIALYVKKCNEGGL